ncbi:MAG: hypothetical protein ACO1G9_05810 [Bacteroidota bacterium]
MKFVSEELDIALTSYFPPSWRIDAAILGVGLGLAAIPKTTVELNRGPVGVANIIMWYIFSNQGVNNRPDIHKH